MNLAIKMKSFFKIDVGIHLSMFCTFYINENFVNFFRVDYKDFVVV